MKYLIFLDIDGTILPADGVIPPLTLRAVRRAQQKGHLVFINSGRSAGIIPDALLDALKPDGVVAGLGVWIRVGEELLLAESMPTEDVLFAMHIGEQTGNTVILEGENGCIALGDRPWGVAQDRLRTPEELTLRYPQLRVSKLTFVDPLDGETVRCLSERFAVFNHPTYAEVGIKGYSKATGMALLRDRYGVDNEHVIAMGDSDNDTEMLRAAGIAVAMGDALPAIRDMADFVSTDCAAGGVGYAIEKLVLHRSGKELPWV